MIKKGDIDIEMSSTLSTYLLDIDSYSGAILIHGLPKIQVLCGENIYLSNTINSIKLYNMSNYINFFDNRQQLFFH
jgi:hypothetical protein